MKIHHVHTTSGLSKAGGLAKQNVFITCVYDSGWGQYLAIHLNIGRIITLIEDKKITKHGKVVSFTKST